VSNDIEIIKFELVYEGGAADDHLIDLYDVSQALIGFQRSMALTCHLVINGEIITQAPSLKGAKILANPSEEGSWQMVATVLAGIYMIGTAQKETPLGHVVYSAYDYIVSESLGVHVDYDKSLGELFDEYNKSNPNKIKIEQHKLDSLMEKCNTAITDIHRPIFKTKTATSGKIVSAVDDEKYAIGPSLNINTYQYIHEEYISEEAEVIRGRISSYNSNTYKGRIYDASEGRPIAFELDKSCRTDYVVQLITASLAASAVKSYDNEWSEIYCSVYRNTTRSGHLKSYKITEVKHEDVE
jgi:hypothetical protein